MQHVPRYLTSSLVDETIEAVVAGLNTAIYQRPLTPWAPTRQKRKRGKGIRHLLWFPSSRIKAWEDSPNHTRYSRSAVCCHTCAATEAYHMYHLLST